MNLDELIVDLSSNSLRTVLDAVAYLSDMVASDSLTADVVDTVFHAIVPLLSHNHYKIRYYAFLCLAGIFMDHFEVLTDCIDALPSILLSLLSVNQQIKTSAYDCLKIILTSFCYNTIYLYTHSVKQYNSNLLKKNPHK